MAETYVLDTNILVGYVRDAPYSRFIDATYGPLQRDNISVVSIVSHGEVFSLAYQFGWGQKKQKTLENLLRSVSATPINVPGMVERYAEIDAYSQGKLPGQPLPKGGTSNQLGKNDLWIAATASMMEAPLITTDKDFDVLDGKYIDLIYVAQDDDYSEYE